MNDSMDTPGHEPARWPRRSAQPKGGERRTSEVDTFANRASDMLWLRVSLSVSFDAGGVGHWHQRLHKFLSGCGLVAAISPERIAICPNDEAITSFDRGLIIGWLTAQPEVVFAHVDRGQVQRGGVSEQPTHEGRRHG